MLVSSLQEQRRLGAGSRAVGLVQAQHLWAQPAPTRWPVSGELSFASSAPQHRHALPKINQTRLHFQLQAALSRSP